MKHEVVVVGTLFTDVVLSVPRVPGRDDEVEAYTLKRFLGGSAGNSATALSRLGKKVALVSIVGEDREGQRQLSALRASGVDVEGVAVSRNKPTGTAFVLVDPQGERSIVSHAGASEQLGRKLILPDSLWRAKLIHFAGGVNDGNVSCFRRILERARYYGIKTSIDLDSVIAAKGLGLVRRLSVQWDVIFLSGVESELLSRSMEHEAGTITDRLKRISEIVVLKRGNQGCEIVWKGGRLALPAFPTAVVDTTGAGDVFAAGLLSCYLDGESLESCGEFANSCAALKIAHSGAREGLPTRQQVTAFIRSTLEAQEAR